MLIPHKSLSFYLIYVSYNAQTFALKNDIGFKFLRFILTKSQYLDINIKVKYVYNNSKVGVNEGTT